MGLRVHRTLTQVLLVTVSFLSVSLFVPLAEECTVLFLSPSLLFLRSSLPTSHTDPCLLSTSASTPTTYTRLFESVVPISFYSASFSPAKNFSTQWPSSQEILSYWKNLVLKYQVSSRITYSTLILSAKWIEELGIWELEVKNLKSGEVRIESCNVLISAVGALSTPSPAPFDTSQFEGKIVHTGDWDESIDLKDKNVVVLGNGCSGNQMIPVSKSPPS